MKPTCKTCKHKIKPFGKCGNIKSTEFNLLVWDNYSCNKYEKNEQTESNQKTGK